MSIRRYFALAIGTDGVRVEQGDMADELRTLILLDENLQQFESICSRPRAAPSFVVAFVLLPYFPNTGDAPAAPETPPPDPSPPAGFSPVGLETLRAQAARAEADLPAARRRE